MKMRRFVVSSIAVALFPFVAFAATKLEDVILSVQALLGTIAPLIIALAVLYFFWGLAQYILGASDETKKSEGRNIMIYGIIAIFVMSSVWGLVALISGTFNLPTTPTAIISGPGNIGSLIPKN
jgi:hypothetical protein